MSVSQGEGHQEEDGKSQEWVSVKIVFVGHDRAVAHLSSQFLGIHAQDVHMTKPVKVPAWVGEGPMKSHP